MNKQSPAPTTASFKDISDFMNAFAPEVSGRSTDAVTPELHNKLASLAAGRLAENEGRDISRELLSNENAMKTLADLLTQNP
ncbi:MAG: hypothetical protein H7A51_00655 [Akkermansiaceae bacterium]|nr:hypothetical protein [Akkermansiaceae bacterium]